MFGLSCCEETDAGMIQDWTICHPREECLLGCWKLVSMVIISTVTLIIAVVTKSHDPFSTSPGNQGECSRTKFLLEGLGFRVYE